VGRRYSHTWSDELGERRLLILTVVCTCPLQKYSETFGQVQHGTVLVSRYKYLEIGFLSHNHATISRIFRCPMPDTSTLRCGYRTVHVPLKVHMPFKVLVHVEGRCRYMLCVDLGGFVVIHAGYCIMQVDLHSPAPLPYEENFLHRHQITGLTGHHNKFLLLYFLRLHQSWKISVN